MRLGTTLRVMLFIRSSRSRGAGTRKKLIGFAASKLDRGPALVRIGGEKGSPMEMRINSVLAQSKWARPPRGVLCKTLKLSFGDNENANPFTIYEGQLVFPNIPKRRQFWEKI